MPSIFSKNMQMILYAIYPNQKKKADNLKLIISVFKKKCVNDGRVMMIMPTKMHFLISLLFFFSNNAI